MTISNRTHLHRALALRSLLRPRPALHKSQVQAPSSHLPLPRRQPKASHPQRNLRAASPLTPPNIRLTDALVPVLTRPGRQNVPAIPASLPRRSATWSHARPSRCTSATSKTPKSSMRPFDVPKPWPSTAVPTCFSPSTSRARNAALRRPRPNLSSRIPALMLSQVMESISLMRLLASGACAGQMNGLRHFSALFFLEKKK